MREGTGPSVWLPAPRRQEPTGRPNTGEVGSCASEPMLTKTVVPTWGAVESPKHRASNW